MRDMSSEGFDISSYYTRTPESNDPRVSWAFEGIGYDERLGDFGLVGGGAAGTELDIVDTTLVIVSLSCRRNSSSATKRPNPLRRRSSNACRPGLM